MRSARQSPILRRISTGGTKNSRSSREMRDKNSRPALADHPANLQEYDTVLLGFPIWWYTAPTIINTFLESHDFSGKTISHPVCHFGRQRIRQYSTGSEAQCGFLGSDPGGAPSEWQAPGICDPGMALGAGNLSRRSTAIPGTWGTGFFRWASAWKSRFPKVRNHSFSTATNCLADRPLAVF